MGIVELKKMTTVYDRCAVATMPAFWVASNAVEFKSCGGTRVAYAHIPDSNGGVATLDELPTEFFSHELMSLDVDDDSQLAEFVKCWGFPFSPLRNPGVAIDELPHLLDFEAHANAVGASENALENAISANCEGLESIDLVARDVISQEEARVTLSMLQECVSNLFDAIADNGSNPSLTAKSNLALRLVNLCASNPMRIGTIQVIGAEPNAANGFISLTSAICNQIIDTCSDPFPWRLCANRDGRKPCNRIFKRKRTDAKSSDIDARFCCKKCADADKQRRKRAKSKANPAQ